MRLNDPTSKASIRIHDTECGTPNNMHLDDPRTPWPKPFNDQPATEHFGLSGIATVCSTR